MLLTTLILYGAFFREPDDCLPRAEMLAELAALNMTRQFQQVGIDGRTRELWANPDGQSVLLGVREHTLCVHDTGTYKR